jgi:hypothetical protein
MAPQVGFRPCAPPRRADRRLSGQPLRQTVPIARRRPSRRAETRRTSTPMDHQPPTTQRHRGGRDTRRRGPWQRQRWRTCSCSAASSRRTDSRRGIAPGYPHSRWDQLAWRRTLRLRLRRVRGAPRRERSSTGCVERRAWRESPRTALQRTGRRGQPGWHRSEPPAWAACSAPSPLR